jgi:serine/threonine protein kinase
LDIIQAHPGGLYLVFEYVAHDLKTYMDQFQKSDDITERVGLPVATVRSFLRQIIAGVGCCHTYRILHRDLKPHNVSHSKDTDEVAKEFLYMKHSLVCQLQTDPQPPLAQSIISL